MFKRYMAAAVIGAVLFAAFAVYSYNWRGGFAVGGEFLMLLMPVWYAMYRGILKGEW